MIPKIIHQTWRNKNLKNDCFEACVKSIKNKHKDYQYKFYTDQDCREIIKKDFQEFLQVYDSITPVEKADLFRYLIVYKYGGIYLDIDCYCVRNFDDLIKDADFVAGYEQGWKVDDIMRYTQWAFAAKRNHPILLECAYRCKSNHLGCSDMWTLKKTGPTMWTKVINQFKNEYDLKLGGESWFGSRIFGVNSKESVPFNERKNIIHAVNKNIVQAKDIYIIHLFYGSWLSSKKTNMQIISQSRVIERMAS